MCILRLIDLLPRLLLGVTTFRSGLVRLIEHDIHEMLYQLLVPSLSDSCSRRVPLAADLVVYMLCVPALLWLRPKQAGVI